MSTEEDLEAIERESATTGALLRRIDERVASVGSTCRDIVDELARVGTALIAIETWKASANLRIEILERDTAELRAILRALKESRLEHAKSRKRLALQNLIASIVIVAGIVLRTVLFGGH